MRKTIIIKISILLLSLPIVAIAQGNRADSLRQILNQATDDSVRTSAYWGLYDLYEESNWDSARFFIEEALRISKQKGKKLAEARCLVSLAYEQLAGGRYAESLGNLLQAFSIIEKNENETNNWLSNWSDSPQNVQPLLLSYAHHMFANLMTATRNTSQQVIHYREALKLGKQVGNPQRIIRANLGLGRAYLDNNLIDSALVFEKEAARVSQESGLTRYVPGIMSYIGALYFEKKEPELALQSLYYGIEIANEYGNPAGRLGQIYYRLTKYYLSEKNKDSALYYALNFKQAMEKVGAVSLSTVDIGIAYEYLSLAYKMNNQQDSAVRYLELALITKESINNSRINSLAEFQNLNLQEQLRLRDIGKEQELYQSKVRSYALLAGLVVFSVIAIILYRNNKQKQNTNRTLENTLSNLRSTQAQLIQSEKMASLGELTAGIAHEIQNPLNFVNNFSELNKELLDEVKIQTSKVNNKELDDMIDLINQNNGKINLHGNRADAIVKSMQQHSRSSLGVKELTDINALAEEYLRLSYHGLRAKDKSFQSDYKFSSDPLVDKVNVVPQDLGRVLLNLINNAFYAVQEKSVSGIPGFKPMVEVTTSRSGDNVILTVKDNGKGIPEAIRQKIFQPFFTTKPAGEGTGLGLSLSYDIIKAHGGEIRVESKEGEGSVFTISIPIA